MNIVCDNYGAVSTIVLSEEDWFSRSLVALKKDTSYQAYRKQVDNAAGAKELLDVWKNRRKSNLNKVRYFVGDDSVSAKINRFSHAMDPDRGILTFISFMFSETHRVFGIYALKRTSKTLKKDIDSICTMQHQLKVALDKDRKDGGGVTEWFEQLLINLAENATALNDTIDITCDLLKNRKELEQNKVVFTILYLLDGIYLNHNGICLKWDKRKLVNSVNKNFWPAFSKLIGFSAYTRPTPIVEVVDGVDEDEVTYTIVHKILIPNGFQIVSVSYPGSQGGGAILPNPKLGKAQPREYLDVIALPPIRSNIDIVLNESKGIFSKTDVEKDIEKLLRYKTDGNLKTALRNTLLTAQVIDANKQLKNIVIGVAFGAKNGTSTTWKPDNVDFILRIVNRHEWAIAIFKQDMRDLITKIEGKTNFPTVYKLSKPCSSNSANASCNCQTELFP